MRYAACLVLLACNSPSTNVKSEAEVYLDRLARNAKLYWIDKATPPIGTAPLTPAEDCCKHPGGKCPTMTTEQWETSNRVWRSLHFRVEAPSGFRFSYESKDGFHYVATAVGDLDCDGVTVTYRLEGRIVDSDLVTTIVPPANPD